MRGGADLCNRVADSRHPADNAPMAARPTWKGFLKISLVNIPVRVFPATDSAATISFNQLHAECQTRIQQKRWCPKCEREMPISEVAKGYEFEKGRYVVMDDEDMAKVRPESTRVIDLVQFTERSAIDPIYFERPYYLAPDGQMALESFAVMREGMKGKAGIGKLALYGREYLVAVQPKDKGLMMYTMRRANEMRSMDAIEELESVPAKVKPEEIKLAKQVIANFEGRAGPGRLQGRLPGRAAADHRRQDRRRGSRRDRGRGAAQGGQPDGRTAPEPRSREHREEEGGEGRGAREGQGRAGEETRARLARRELVEILLPHELRSRATAGPHRQRHRIIAADINPPAIGLAVVFDLQRRIAGPQFAQRDLRDPLDLLHVHGA